MNIDGNNRRHARRVAHIIADTGNPITRVLSGTWHWIDGLAHGLSHFIGSTITSALKVILQHLENLASAILEISSALGRLVVRFDRLIWHVVRGWIIAAEHKANANLAALRRYLLGVIFISTQTVLTIAMRAVRVERQERQRAIARAEAQADARIRALHGVIEREASSGYRVDRDARVSVIVHLLDFAAGRNPEVRAITRDIASGLLDLLTVDNPVARILLSFLITKVIDRLGIDKAVGGLISGLMAPLLRGTEPRDLHDVILDLSQRLDAVEAQWATFMQDGGSQVEQAGKDWRDITSLTVDAGIVAFAVEAVINPAAWAGQIANTVGTAANDVAAKAAALFKG